ncbi:MAG TPA: thiamine phosphate synthase [Chthoniobacterales bacterium]|nr:thiamine phosphate synthase [Chthoniobacterales bacterium]
MTKSGIWETARLYGILDLAYISPTEAGRVAREMISGGVDLIQLRAKRQTVSAIAALAADIHPITSAAGTPLVINDHAEIARDIAAEGVHVGQDDRSVAEVRSIVSADCFIGKSTHSLAQAKRAVAEGADYIGWGPLFATPTKPDYLPIGLDEIATVHAAVQLPIFCIGGIKLENLGQVVAAGARRVVIVSGLLQAADVAEYARSAKALLNHTSNFEPQK